MDEPKDYAPPAAPSLTDAQIVTLAELADGLASGRRAWRWISKAALFATGAAALAYYVIGVINGWHDMGLRKLR